MENVNETILADYRLIISRLYIMKGELTELQRSNSKLRKSFTELLDIYQETLDRFDSLKDRFDSLKDRSDVEYECNKIDKGWNLITGKPVIEKRYGKR